jgi:uncharacterized protein (UPF0261 family)
VSKVYVIGTCDTKGDELRFACDCVHRAGAKPLLVDVSTAVPDKKADVTAGAVASRLCRELGQPGEDHRREEGVILRKRVMLEPVGRR